MRMIAKVAVVAAVSAGALLSVGGQAVADDGGSSRAPGSTTGWPPGTAGTPLAVLLCALQGGVVGSSETSPPQCHLP